VARHFKVTFRTPPYGPVARQRHTFAVVLPGEDPTEADAVREAEAQLRALLGPRAGNLAAWAVDDVRMTESDGGTP
jgi:hypothetical protein